MKRHIKLICTLLMAAWAVLTMSGACAADTAGDISGAVEEYMESHGLSGDNFAMGWYDTVTGESWYFGADSYMPAGSMYKLPLNMLYADAIAAGEVREEDIVGGWQVGRAMYESIVNSNNDCAQALRSGISPSLYEYRDALAAWSGIDTGELPEEYYTENCMSPRFIINTLLALYEAPDRYGGIMENMKQAAAGHYFQSADIDWDIAHKYGSFEGQLNDCAVVYTPRPFLLVVFLKNVAYSERVLADICALTAEVSVQAYERDEALAAAGGLTADSDIAGRTDGASGESASAPDGSGAKPAAPSGEDGGSGDGVSGGTPGEDLPDRKGEAEGDGYGEAGEGAGTGEAAVSRRFAAAGCAAFVLGVILAAAGAAALCRRRDRAMLWRCALCAGVLICIVSGKMLLSGAGERGEPASADTAEVSGKVGAAEDAALTGTNGLPGDTPDANAGHENVPGGSGQSGEEAAGGDNAGSDTPGSGAEPPEGAADPDGSGEAEGRWVLSFAGDCTIGTLHEWQGSRVSSNMLYVCGEDMSYPFSNVSEYFKQDDLTIVNLEGAFTDETAAVSKDYRFRAPAGYADVLTLGGVDAVTLANNHSGDYLDAGLEDTKSALDERGILWTDASQPIITELEGGLKLGIISFNAVEIDLAVGDVKGYLERMEPAYRQCRQVGCGIVAAYIHWGWEYRSEPEDWMVELAHALADMGCDIVAGSHAHVLQGTENYNGVPIFYGLGNFCFGGHSGPKDMDTVIVQQEIVKTDAGYAVGDTVFIPCSISSAADRNDFRPTPFAEDSGDWERVLEKLGVPGSPGSED